MGIDLSHEITENDKENKIFREAQMSTGKRLLSNCMPSNYKQGSLYPASEWVRDCSKPHGGSKKRKAGHVRKAAQSKLRKQLKKDLLQEL